ncbi:hypothetical protein [Streptomyces violaceusniger]|uniref:hypothetical protein n=1 Tax=Streptomyces violaceusniger TaxID=68280 RepID=UPI0005B98710|nr:hypothetical protein [Streptomyces violaceusniger]
MDFDAGGEGELSAPGHVSAVFQDARLLPWKRVPADVALGFNGADSEERARAALAEGALRVAGGSSGEPGGSRFVSADALTEVQVAGVPHNETPKGVH